MNNILITCLPMQWTISRWISWTNEKTSNAISPWWISWANVQCRQQPNTPHTAVGSQVFFICTSLFFVFIARFFYFYFHVYHAIFSYDSEGVESPTRLHAFWTLFCFASYHFATLNESFHWDSMYIIGGYTPLMKILRKKLYSINHSWVVALRLCYFSKVSAIYVQSIQYEQAVRVKRLVPLFGCTVCPHRVAGSVVGILGYLIRLRCSVLFL
jgi:hypothetical protein